MTRFRYDVLRLCRILGRFGYWARSGLGPIILCLIITAFGVWLAEHIAISLHLFNLKAGTWFQFWYILGMDTLLALGWLAWKARKRIVVEEFVDYTIKDKSEGDNKNDQSQSSVKGLATLLVVKLAQLRELYQAVNEQRPISTDAGVDQSIEASINVEDVKGLLKDAVSAESKIGLGPLQIPIGTLMLVIARIFQGPRIIGSLHGDHNSLILTAQRIGSKQSNSWRVDDPESAEKEINRIDKMITDLAYQVFADLELKGVVRWKALKSFSEGLQIYHDCLRTLKDKALNLKQAQRKLIEAIAEDEKFEIAYYNLGVLYIELKQNQAAEAAFLEAISRNSASWRSYYALMIIHYEREQYRSVIQLCDRVISLKPGFADTAKAYHWKGLAQRYLLSSHNPADLKSSIQSRKRSVNRSWLAIYMAELKGRGISRTNFNPLPRIKILTSVCLIDLAVGYSYQAQFCNSEIKKNQPTKPGLLFKQPILVALVEGVKFCYESIKQWLLLQRCAWLFRRAEPIFFQALFLFPSNADYHFQLGGMYYEWGEYDRALQKFEAATQIQPDNVEYWAFLANTYTRNGDKESAQYAYERFLERVALASEDSFGRIAKVKEGKSDKIKQFLAELKQDEIQRDTISLIEKLELYKSDDQNWEYAQVSLALWRCFLEADVNEARKYFQNAMSNLEKYSQEIRLQGLHTLFARALLEAKEYGMALQEVEKALSLDPLSSFARYVLGEVYHSMNEFERAIAAWEESLLRKPDDSDIYYNIGVSYIELGMHYREPSLRNDAFRRGISKLRQALDLYKSDQQQSKGKTRFFLGNLHFELGEYEEAISNFNIARALNYSPLSSTFYLGYAYLQNKEYNRSIETFDTLLENHALKNIDQITQSTNASTRVIEVLTPRILFVLANWGLAAANAERDGEFNLNKAMEYNKKAEENVKNLNKDEQAKVYSKANYLDTKGWIYYKQGDYIQAIQILEEALSLSTDAKTYLRLALAYEAKLQTSKDRAELQLCIARVRLHCEHVLELDMKEEYKQSIKDILERLSEYEQLLKNLLQGDLNGKGTGGTGGENVGAKPAESLVDGNVQSQQQ